jgi:hypothetical protein
MKAPIPIPPRAMNVLIVLLLLAGFLGTAGSVSAQLAVYNYGNNLTLPAGTPLPIFQVTSPTVTPGGTSSLALNFANIYVSGQDPGEDMVRGYTRFSFPNEGNNTLLEQFGATGGFHAYNPGRAFGQVLPDLTRELDPGAAQAMACYLLAIKPGLVTPSNNLQIPGLSDVNCDHNFTTTPLYKVSTETLGGQSSVPGAMADPPQPLRLIVRMPINIDIGIGAPLLIPLGGPGGHISMIFDNTSPNANPALSLETQVPGLQAVAMPAFGRTFSPFKSVPAVDPAAAKAQILSQIKAAFPSAQNPFVPEPVLEYFVTEAGEPQKVMEPKLTFSGITVLVDGQELPLKDISLPAVQSGPLGLGPTVVIDSPVNGSAFIAGKPVTLQGTISDGVAPYSYDWQLDDGTSLLAAPSNPVGAGSLPPLSTVLPAPDPKGLPGTQTIHLVVTDTDGITRQATVTLNSSVPLYLPLVSRGFAPAADTVTDQASEQKSAVFPALTNLTATNYRFGVEYGSDYPPYGSGGPDLGGVPGDANGFSAGLMGLGWPRVFNWFNALAWERDWRDCSLSGSDCTYGVDRADFVYYSGHGSAGTIYMPSNNHDSSWVDATKARFQNARWVGFSSCQTLRAQATPPTEPIRKWFNSFQGSHMLLGFNSNMADIAFGKPLVDNMRLPSFCFFGACVEFPWAQRTIAAAWVQTAFQLNAGKPAYIYATSASVNPLGNKLPKVTDPPLPRPFPANWFYWVWWNE